VSFWAAPHKEAVILSPQAKNLVFQQPQRFTAEMLRNEESRRFPPHGADVRMLLANAM